MIARDRARRRAWAAVGIVALLLLLGVGGLVLRAAEATSGAGWQEDGLANEVVHSLAIGEARPGLVIAGTGDGVYRRVGDGRWKRLLAAETVWAVTILPDERTVVVGDEAGQVDITHDAGRTWRHATVSPGGVFAVTAEPGEAKVILAGGGGGLFRSSDGGRHWHRTLRLPKSAGAAFAWWGSSRPTVFAGAVAGAAGGSTQVYESRDAGAHWTLFGRGLPSLGGIMSLAINGQGDVLVGTMGNRIWQRRGVAGRWREIARGIPAHQHVAAIIQIPGSSGQLYIGTLAAGVLRSRNGGRSWSSVSDGLPSDGGSQIVLSLAYARQRHLLYAGTTQGVYLLSAR